MYFRWTKLPPRGGAQSEKFCENWREDRSSTFWKTGTRLKTVFSALKGPVFKKVEDRYTHKSCLDCFEGTGLQECWRPVDAWEFPATSLGFCKHFPSLPLRVPSFRMRSNLALPANGVLALLAFSWSTIPRLWLAGSMQYSCTFYKFQIHATIGIQCIFRTKNTGLKARFALKYRIFGTDQDTLHLRAWSFLLFD